MTDETTDFELWLEDSAPREDILESLHLMQILLLSSDSKRDPYESWKTKGMLFIRRTDSGGSSLVLVLESKKAVSDFFAVVSKEYGNSEEESKDLVIKYPVLSNLENL